MKIPFYKPSITKRETDAVTRVMESGWLTTGEETLKFEEEFASHINVKYALAVNSCTSGLFLALLACGIGPGDEVILPSFTFVATANVITHCGATPVLCDIDKTLTINPSSIIEKITPKTKAIIGVHYNGIPCNKEILEIAHTRGLFYIEDCAHAFKGKTDQGYMGAIGDIGVFSFYATKPITTGEGGMITTDNPRLAKKIELLRNHGISTTVWDRYTNVKSDNNYDVLFPGYKFNMPDIMATIGRVQLSRCDEMAEKRKEIASFYNDNLAIVDKHYPSKTNHLYVIHPQDRADIEKQLNAKGIGTSVHFKPVHFLSAYKKDDIKLPVSEHAWVCFLSLPIYPDLTMTEQKYIIDSVNSIAKAKRCFPRIGYGRYRERI